MVRHAGVALVLAAHHCAPPFFQKRLAQAAHHTVHLGRQPLWPPSAARLHQGLAYRGIDRRMDMDLYGVSHFVGWASFSSASRSQAVPLGPRDTPGA